MTKKRITKVVGYLSDDSYNYTISNVDKVIK